ncbi:MAG: primosomal protein N' [Sodaliphilus sp.]
MAHFAELIIPLAIKGTYTYRIPEEMQADLQIGCRVLVPFGRKKIYTGIVQMMHDMEPKGYEVKSIIAMIDPTPIVVHPQLKFWQWISDYYLCTLGEVMKAALPAGLKIESETYISVNPDYEESQPGELNDKLRCVLDFTAQKGRMQVNEISRITEFCNVESMVHKLVDLGAIHVSERVVDNYRAKTEVCVRLTVDRADDAALHRVFDEVKRAKKQEALLLAYLDLSGWLQKSKPAKEVTKDALLKRSGVTQPVLAAARQRGIFETYRREINRFADLGSEVVAPPTLSADQQRAYHAIHQCFKEKAITLLHGVTSSGKTTIYMHLIKDALNAGKQALYLVPEIALTTQLTRRLRKVFGEKLLIYHSKFSDNERVDIWKRLLHHPETCVVIGVRSSIFLPYRNLGLIIVDEEHDTSYKQQDPAPRYNGRNAAMVLASMHGAKTLLGSGTPSIEMYHHAQNGDYGLVELLTRYENITMPEVKVVDAKLARKKKEMRGLFTSELVHDCHAALSIKEQVILFQNRRGYSPSVCCKECGWVPKCENCDVSLTYHKHIRTLTCHYCGYTQSMTTLCPTCGLPGLEIVGYGTERIEDDVKDVFPNEKILRMDLDTTRNKNSYDRIIDEFSSREANILVGTQMVTKGLDFDGVSVVGILNADSIISFPDFRSSERAFNMLEQVSGRAGRAHKQGLVVIQTYTPTHPIIKFVQEHDFKGFYEYELEERRKFKYPPFTRIVNVYMKHRHEDTLTEISVRYVNMLHQVFGNRVFGPEPPMVARVQNLHIRQIMLKFETEASMVKVKAILRNIYEQLAETDHRMKSTILYYDVDPM